MRQVVTNINDLDLDGTYTVIDYLSWQFDELVQLIKGKIVRKSPSPLDVHSRLSLEVVLQVGPQIKNVTGKKCILRFAPSDVYLPVPNTKKGNENTVVQPDIFIVADPTKIKRRGCYGAPDWICEIVSKGSFKLDTVIKRDLYAEAGVLEYFIIYPEEAAIQVYNLQPDGTYGNPEVYDKPGQRIEFTSIPGIVLEMDTLFPPDVEIGEN